MAGSPMDALRTALQNDEALRTRFAEAQTEEEILAIARDAGVNLAVGDLSGSAELSDAELEAASGGYTFPATDWIYCENPWTNAWCTLKC